ncbi:hypothetical protein NDU88_002646 [Pleurodeles waltl]|uniref:Uncharacterized protein n=1 Tax=Pleurodeles waltl TaxID=8319 RepID=A0AAV7P7K6_PLEWA|nr:hypothetical protein NDU88_002646 [Pleurodeles waltl]
MNPNDDAILESSGQRQASAINTVIKVAAPQHTKSRACKNPRKSDEVARATISDINGAMSLVTNTALC